MMIYKAVMASKSCTGAAAWCAPWAMVATCTGYSFVRLTMTVVKSLPVLSMVLSAPVQVVHS